MSNTDNEQSAKWSQVTVSGTREQMEDICAVMCMLDNGLMIEDYSDLTEGRAEDEIPDEELLALMDGGVKVSLFVPEEKPLSEYTCYLREQFAALDMEVEISVEGLCEKDWAENWKKYYHPLHFGRLTVVPAWEQYTPAEGEITLRMDPGMAFGTGSHETTGLVISLLEKRMPEGARVLDVGCGSGILSICARKLGAAFCAAYDIDPVAVRVAQDNFRENGLEDIVCARSDLLANVDKSLGRFDFVVANIVADIIIRLLPLLGDYVTPNATYIFSGIIGERAEEVRRALAENGFVILEEGEKNDWTAIVACVAAKD